MSVSDYNVIWDTPSKDSSGSMPLGNGDIGLNVWVEEDGDLLFYISKMDAWDENGRLIKLGRVRVRLSPNPFRLGVPFCQALELERGQIRITAGPVTVCVWVDANRPVVRVQAAGAEAFDLCASLEVWRDRPRELAGNEASSAYGLHGGPAPIIEDADTVLPASRNRIVWYHRNTRSVWEQSMQLQGLSVWAAGTTDPILNRTFGGAILGQGLVSENAATLKSQQRQKEFDICVFPLTRVTATVDQWLSELDRQIAEAERTDPAAALAEHERWWRAFWDRSYIHVTGTDSAKTVSQGYALQRFISACAGRGEFPIKFNGSIFTVDAREPEKVFDADFREWGGPYWFQNTRLAYWPMLAGGDFEMMRPLFKMYLDALPLARERTKLYFGHDGAFFPETMYFWGAYANTNYGWDRTGKHVSHVDNTYIRWYWSGALELVALALEYFAFTGDREFVRSTLRPLATAVLEFYDQHYSRDPRGKLRFTPAQSLEMWQDVDNPLPEIAGLRFVLPRLLELPADLMGSAEQATWRCMLGELPDVPLREVEGAKAIAPAEAIRGPAMNVENPELYAVFPYRLFGVGKPDLEMGRRTYVHRQLKDMGGWQQDSIQAALLGLADEAGTLVARRFGTKHSGSRFPAFWGPNFDWIPDQDHGTVACIALQTMLMQAEGDKIRLLPAWPKDWDVEFRLHAPGSTVLEGIVRGGAVVNLRVTPPARQADVTIR